MARNGEQRGKVVHLHDTKRKLDDDIDNLFRLPLADFTSERNALAARLKQSGRANDATLIKALTKPSISAWTVNQLYWNERDEFDELIAAGQRVRQFQTSGFAGKVAEMRVALDARTRALTQLSDLAAELLRDAGSNPSLDTLRRIATTLEALSSYASLDDGPTPGRLVEDVDPPGFESLTSFSFGSSATQRAAEAPRQTASKSAAAKSKPKVTTASDARDNQKLRKLEETRQAMLAGAKLSLQSAKKLLAEAEDEAKSLELEQKKAYTEAKEAEKRRREAETQLKKASAIADDAAERSESIVAQAEEAAAAVQSAKRAVEKLSKELESLLREKPAI